AFPPPLDAHVDRLCDYLHTALRSPATHDDSVTPGSLQDTGPPHASHATGGVDAAHLRLLETELAKRIGPVAGHLVRRATQGGGDLDAVARRLAPEIDGEQERRIFLEACWRIGKGK
ncbi:MAG: hypothetical protein JO278_07665, partial [Dyella sp.]|nr:hypothetical protein [Dyella sp.]